VVDSQHKRIGDHCGSILCRASAVFQIWANFLLNLAPSAVSVSYIAYMRYARGVTPTSRWKTVVRCDWLANPQTRARSPIGTQPSGKSPFARSVLVQLEMERWLSPLENGATHGGSSCAAERNRDCHEEPADGNCNWLRRGDQGAVTTMLHWTQKSFRPRAGGGLNLTAEAILEAQGQLARRGTVLNRRCAAYFTG